MTCISNLNKLSELSNYVILFCEEIESKAKVDDDQQLPLEIDYDAAKYTPVFFGPLHKRIIIDGNEDEDFDPSISHPACVGYAFVDRPPESPTPEPPAPPNKQECKHLDDSGS